MLGCPRKRTIDQKHDLRDSLTPALRFTGLGGDVIEGPDIACRDIPSKNTSITIAHDGGGSIHR